MAERRKLAAISAADVVGFSRLIGAGEDRTFARLHNGREVKRTGDQLSRRRGAGSPRLLSPGADVA